MSCISDFLLRLSSFLLFYLNKFISTHILPGLTPNQIEYQIISYYLIIIFSLSISITLINLIHFISPSLLSFRSSTTYDPILSKLSLDHQRTIVDVYIDFNHFDFSSTHHSISFLLLQFKSIVHLSLQNSSFSLSDSLKIVFWSYIDRDRLQLADWVHQLDLLESHFQHGFVQVIDTSQNTIDQSKPTQKPLLNDLLRILNVPPPGRLLVISSSDPDLYGAGIQLIRNHPNSPILAYIPPLGSSLELTESIPNVDYLFMWEKDETVRLVKESRRHQNLNWSPTNSERAVQEFEPLNLILKAHSHSLPLEALKTFLKPWCSKVNESESDHEEEVLNYIDDAINNGIISISEKPSLDQVNPARLIVSHAKIAHSFHLQSEIATKAEALSSLSVEKVLLDDDSLTTTGSETSHRSRSGHSSPIKSPIELSDHLPHPIGSESPTVEVAIFGEDKISKPESISSGIPLKHKHTLDLLEYTGRPIKKNKSQQSSFTPVPSSFIRSGPSSLKKKSLITNKNSPTKVIVGNFSHLVQSGSSEQEKDENQSVTKDHKIKGAQAPLGSFVFCEGIIGLKSMKGDQPPLQKPSLVAINNWNDENNNCESKALISKKNRGPLRFRLSMVWLNCSSGIMIHSLSIDQCSDGSRFKSHIFSRIRNQDVNQMLGFNINLSNLSRYRLNHSPKQEPQEQSEQVEKNENLNMNHSSDHQIISYHLHFKSYLIPALRHVPIPHLESDMALNANSQIQPKLDTRQSTVILPFDLNQVD